MVHIEDLGSQFDAPIEKVWELLRSPTEHRESHPDRRNTTATPESESTMIVSWEQNVQGHWVPVKNRITMLPPVAMFVHSLEGPLGGSKFVTYYSPKGAKTGVSVVGDFQSKVIPAAELQAMVLQTLEHAYHEDNATLRKLAGGM